MPELTLVELQGRIEQLERNVIDLADSVNAPDGVLPPSMWSKIPALLGPYVPSVFQSTVAGILALLAGGGTWLATPTPAPVTVEVPVPGPERVITKEVVREVVVQPGTAKPGKE